MRHLQFSAPGLRALALSTLIAGLALAGCTTRTNTYVSGSVPPQYTHVYLSVQQVWFNTSATAGPGDTGWHQYTLSTPQTVDLVALSNGNVSQFASQLNVPLGTYNQMRLVLADSATTLQSTAQSAGAIYNNEVDYIDSSGTNHQVPLQVPNFAEGIAVPISLTVGASGNNILDALGSIQNLGLLASNPCSTSTNSNGTTTFSGTSDTNCSGCTSTATNTTFGSTTTPCTTSSTGSTTTPCTGATGTTSTTTGTTTGTTTPCTNCSGTSSTTGSSTGSSICVDTIIFGSVSFDAMRDLAPFTATSETGFAWSSRPAGYDLNQSGTISGQLSSGSASLTGAVVMAETPSADGTRNVIAASAPLQSSGSFVLYPLSTQSGAPVQYDLVISGPGIQTTIIQGVPVTVASPSNTTSIQIGVALAAANTFTANVSNLSPAPTTGGWVGFYQTLPGSGAPPYAIAVQPLDPVTGTFDTAVTLSTGSIAWGVYNSGSISFTTATPTEGATSYRVAQSTAVYGDGPITQTVSASASSPSLFTVAAFAQPSGASGTAVSGSVSVANPGKYDRGVLVVTHDGAIVATSALDSYLNAAQSSATFFNSLPGSVPAALYYGEVWVWNSSTPSTTFTRQPYSGAIDLRNGAAGAVALSIE